MSTHRDRPWVPWLAGALAFVITLVAGGLIVLDWGLRTMEAGVLITRIEASEEAMKAAAGSVDAAFEDHTQADATTAERAQLDAELRAIAAEGRDAIAVAGAEIADTPYLPWHRSIETAINAYLAHNLAWQEYLDAASNDPAEFLAPQPLVDSTFLAAQEPLIAAVPVPDVLDLLGRLASIYAPPELAPGQTQEAGLVVAAVTVSFVLTSPSVAIAR